MNAGFLACKTYLSSLDVWICWGYIEVRGRLLGFVLITLGMLGYVQLCLVMFGQVVGCWERFGVFWCMSWEGKSILEYFEVCCGRERASEVPRS